MNFTKSFAPYLATFYYLGMSPCSPNRIQINDDKHRNPMVIVQIVCVLISVLCVIALFISTDSMWKFGPKEVISSLYIFCDIIKAFCIAMQCIVYERHMREISCIFNKLDSFFVIHLNYRIRYELFRNKCATYAFIIITAYGQYLVVLAIRGVIENNFVVFTIPMQFAHLMQSITYLHMIFYIEALAFYLAQLNWVVQRDMEAHIPTKQTFNYKSRILMRNKIKCYKSVHFRLWEVSQRINTFFGWTMIVIFTHAFVKFVYTSYWIFEEYQHGTGASFPNMKIIRKFILPTLCFFVFNKYSDLVW